ncbi:MAG: restriction endonuclease [Alphaproteobacteria bacterium]|nr:restriction endonuclease [Alphaproteobacteria bacterium]
MNQGDFEDILDQAVVKLSVGAQFGDDGYSGSKDFETTVLKILKQFLSDCDEQADPSFHVHAFPDLTVNGYGVEVKHTKKDSWLAVGNSIFEGMRDQSAKRIYVIYGKMGGWPEVRWARYEDCITHVRISHAPRFVVDMDGGSKLFDILGLPYDEFSALSPEEKIKRVREYSRNRLKPGERLWWLEDQDEESAIPVEIKIYMDLSQSEKRILRAEASILCPQICGGSRQKTKYYDVSTYLLRVHGVLAPQTRDLFSAGSVGARHGERGGNYIQRALQDIEPEMRQAAVRLDDDLFIEYWGASCPPNDRIAEWLKMADGYAKNWKPSEHLFKLG